MFRIGGSRLTIARLLAAEIGIILAAAALLCGLLLLGIGHYSGALVRMFLLG